MKKTTLKSCSEFPKSTSFPSGRNATAFVEGDYNNYEDVLNFGRTMDVITIEIEHVNVDALEVLEKEGKVVHPRPSALRTLAPHSSSLSSAAMDAALLHIMHHGDPRQASVLPNKE